MSHTFLDIKVCLWEYLKFWPIKTILAMTAVIVRCFPIAYSIFVIIQSKSNSGMGEYFSKIPRDQLLDSAIKVTNQQQNKNVTVGNFCDIIPSNEGVMAVTDSPLMV